MCDENDSSVEVADFHIPPAHEIQCSNCMFLDLDEVSSFKYLGIAINNRLTWQDHVDQMFSKINKKLCLLKRIRYCLPLDARLLFFKVIPQYCTAHPVLRIITHNKI